ncbi:MAG: 3-dehydroquinate synthase family protein, partial [Acidimicrobiales bacterium]|jgi:5-deoxy-5-amino-3-dehydroquinate synthase
MIVNVDLGDRSYEVILADGARHQLAALIRERAPYARVAVIVTTPSLALQPWFDVTSGIEQHVLTVPDGEAAKTIDVLEVLLEEIALFELSRSDVLVGVGGGALTDLVGFAAATYLRGISLIQIPTSLVGQVDAAIGGKTGVNLRSGKNLVGAFHQPLGVLCDFETIATLPERERLGGLGEVAKCWLLEGGFAAELSDVSAHDLIVMSVTLKAAIVSADEHEGGRRALLNYGHTLAHALEKVALARDSDELRHGEAVAIGLAFAVRLAEAMGRVDAEEVRRHDEVLDFFGLNRRIPEHFPTTSLLEAMAHDKKANHDLTFVLAGAEGFETVHDVDPQLVSDVLETFRGEP